MNIIPKNLETRFADPDMRLLMFKVGGLGIGGFFLDVHMAIPNGPFIARVEGNDKEGFVKLNLKNLEEEFLVSLYHMCRCFREMKRTNIHRVAHRNGYTYFRDITVKLYVEKIENNLIV